MFYAQQLSACVAENTDRTKQLSNMFGTFLKCSTNCDTINTFGERIGRDRGDH